MNDPTTCADVLKQLVKRGDEYHVIMAYQIAFDLDENATQEFLSKVSAGLPASSTPAAKPEGDAMDVDTKSPTTTTTASPEETVFDRVKSILSGSESIKLYLEFLRRNNHADLLILKTTKTALDARSSLYHSAVTFANAFMHAGTTSDEFLRQNLEWLSRASNWTKFSATAALGVIHKGQIDMGQQLLAPYLPQEGVSGSAYSEGGALFALGLIHTNHGHGVTKYLTNALKSTQNETVQHGAALGLGVAAMATDNEEIYEDLKNVLFTDSAVAGEAAGLAMGLVMLGTCSAKAIDEMLQYAHETQHEKIIRGLALGMALLTYGREQQADALIETLTTDKDPILRYGGIYAIAMAYAGTGSNTAIRKLLHVAVSDVNDDVRRAAVMALGFILFKTPKQVPRVVQLLAESFNPHVRYGAALALGISCAGTGMTEALNLLEPLTNDSVDYVRQGALIASSMILIQHNDSMSTKVGPLRKNFEKIIGDRHEDAMAKFGAALGQGILDAGGRNVSISLQSASGHSNMSAIVGMAVFTQFWYWYPLTHFMCLAFTPTAMIGLNKDLKMPKFEFVSNARPSAFAYPPATKPPEKETIEKVATAVLSTTAKAKARERQKAKEAAAASGGVAPMETDEKEKKDEKKVEEGEGAESEAAKKDEKKKPVKEPSSEQLGNLARVLRQQVSAISFPPTVSRYVPIKNGAVNGIVLCKDMKSGETEEFLEMTVTSIANIAPSTGTGAAALNDVADEPAPPAPFEYSDE